MGYIMDLRRHVGHAPLMMPSASAIVVNRRGEILLQRRTDDGCWGYCGGAMEPGETFEACAARETLEETGLTCCTLEPLALISGAEGHHFYPNGDEVYVADALYVCHDYKGTLTPQAEEVAALGFFAPDALPEPLFSLSMPGLRRYFAAQGLPFPSPCLRGAVPGDRAALGELYCAAWRAAYAGLIPDGYLAGLTPEGCAPGPGRIGGFVAERDGRAVGHVSFGASRDAEAADGAEIYALYVRPDAWRRGLGGRLLAAARGELLRRGYEKAHLWVLRDNYPARRFYEKQGLREAGERSFALAGTPLREVRYELLLRRDFP